MQEIFRANRPFFVLYLVFLLAGGISQLVWSPTVIFLFINGSYNDFSDVFFRYFTNVGDGAFFILVIFGLLFVKYRYAMMALGGFALSSLLAQFLKRVVFSDVLRPKSIFEGTSYAPHWIKGMDIHAANSFPSGHATTAFAVFCLLGMIGKNKKTGVLWFALALLAAYSRVYLGQHFFADIYFGSLLGVSSSIAMYLIFNHLLERNPRNWYQQNLLQW